MTQYAVTIIKNIFHPLIVPETAHVEQGQQVLVRTESGEEVAKVYAINDAVAKAWQKKKTEPLHLIRVLGEHDRAALEELYYTAPERVDFRGLLKDLTQVFKRVRIDLRHIGVRDETALLEGNGLCGRPFCCCTFLRNFESINIKLAKDQGMPITPGKISGTCGRLLCCLDYEYKNYIDFAKHMPPIGSGVMTPDGLGKVCLLNFLSGKITVKLEDGKISEYKKEDIEMIDGEVNIEIDDSVTAAYQEEPEYNIDIKQLED